MDPNALIVDEISLPCAANGCDSLVTLVQRAIRFRDIQEQRGGFLPKSISFVPDVILLRASIDAGAQRLIEACREKWSNASIIALFCPGWDERTREISSLLSCVDDFLTCPFQAAELSFRIKRLLSARNRNKIASYARQNRNGLRFQTLVGQSESFLRVVEKIPLLAESDTTVLISGETGSGKEVVARAIHYQGSRQGKPFIPVNCGALPDHLCENELFGHTKGAFTDASSAEKGLIAEAEGGTLFLDEIDALSPSAQVKLLRFLQDGEYRALGSSRSTIADVRVIAATNADLMQLIKSKLFREDLYYRLNSLSLPIPPLRERMEDIHVLALHFLAQYAQENQQHVRDISRAALQKLMAHTWPGNVRELESVITRALVLSASPTLQAEDIDLPLAYSEELSQSQSLREAKTATMRAFEQSYLMKLLVAYHGNITHAAQAAGKERRAFQRLLRKYSLDRQRFQL